jgi:hypothetical protein
MQKRSKLTIALAPVAAIVLSLVSNVATNNLPPKVRPPVWSIWTVLVALAALVVLGEVRSQRHESEKTGIAVTDSLRLSEASTVLARAVRDQWRAEADIRSLNHPDPIRVRWSSTERPVSASPSSILGTAIPAGRLLRLHLRGDVTQIVGMFNRLPYRQLVILGAPGAGKSAMALLLTLKMLASREGDSPVPVLLSLSSWNPTREHLLAWIARRIREDYPGLSNADLYGPDAPQLLLSEGKIIPILDGLDEIPKELRADSISGMVQGFGRGQPFIVSCRIEEYEDAVAASGDVLGSAAVVEILPIDIDQVIIYLSSLGPASQVRWSQVFTRLRQDPRGPIAMALSTPLIVWLARIAYSDAGSRPEELLDSTLFNNSEAIEAHLLDKFVPAVYKPRPPAPGDRPRMRVDPRDADRWLRFLARSLSSDSAVAYRGMYAGDQTDIAWWRLYQTVSSLQLSLAVWFIVGPLVATPIIAALAITFQLTVHRLLAGFICIGIVLSAGVVMVIRLWPPPPGRIQIRSPRRGQIPGNLRTGLISGSLAGVTASLAAGLGALELKGLYVALKFGLQCGLLAGAVIFIVTIFNNPVDTVRASSPESLFKGDRAVAIACFVLSAPAVGLTAWFLVRNGAESVGAALSAAIGVGLAMSSWGWYSVTIVWLYFRGKLPFHFMKFSMDAYERGVLRRAGAVYQFRHARLQARLTDIHRGDLVAVEKSDTSKSKHQD